ncbi:acyltransferase family protein [Cellulomonas dongxiuzhuiae]|uniref:Acyltransferase n=1 Tax=Cellulomonas dongxiuzhuiae TaxID=2819979 RepID=A0ABX8GKX9_9CELL|nr:acyltransferase [Cellulomonas dongxiuzhuiae]MBO3096367.1 acyltransferase [Cellulomonas dongxiuzhuiae]QWC16779.1 acyltransferase [Cellulomonas dongxiuzhuiae]
MTSPTTDTIRPTQERLRSLDGLRGAAAVIVLIHHCLLTFPSLAAPYYGSKATGMLAWAMTYTPLHIVWAGTEAVYLFFVLSGLVLTLPAVRSGLEYSWGSYYSKRFVRLYLPVFAAVALGAALVALFPRSGSQGLGAWVNNRADSYTLHGLVKDLVLVTGPSGVISTLWSLRWEVLFSVLLPLFVVGALKLRKRWLGGVLAAVALVATGSAIQSPYIFYMSMFAIGSLLAVGWDAIQLGARRLNGKPWAWPSLLLASLVLSCSAWIVAAAADIEWSEANRFTSWMPVVGVTLFVLAAGCHAPTRRLLETRPAAWLGSISFSLYLVHEPLVLAARHATFPLTPWVGVAISVPASIAIAWLFARFVERPSHQLANRVGRRLGPR